MSTESLSKPEHDTMGASNLYVTGNIYFFPGSDLCQHDGWGGAEGKAAVCMQTSRGTLWL